MNYRLQRLIALKEKYGEPETLNQMFEFLKRGIEDFGHIDGRGSYLLGLAWSISFRDKVSNTHYCPAEGETNWGCKPDKPRGYPGYSGRVWARIGYEHRDSFAWVSDVFAQCCTYTGTGGGGAYDGPWKDVCNARFQRYGHKRHHTYYPEIKCYSWDFRFFHDDFPLIKDLWEKHNLFKVIETNDKKIDIQDYQVWEDPDTAAADKAFMEECKNEVA